MSYTTLQKTLIFLMRVSLGWVFLWAAMRQLVDPKWSASQFLAGAKTFPGFYSFFMEPAMLPIVNVLVKWGHLLIGISLILGVWVRVSAVFGTLLMLLYFFPRLDFPYVTNVNNFIIEYHLVYAMVLVYLAAVRAGRFWGLENWFANLPPVASVLERRPQLQAILG